MGNFGEELDTFLNGSAPGMVLNGLPVLVADDDFLEYLQEESLGPTVELDDLLNAWNEWAAANVE
jgi:hypothetical protein